MAAPTAPRKNFITRDHRYVYLGGSFIALLGLSMFYSAPSPYSFIPAQSVFGTALAVICWFFLGVSAMALLVKWAYPGCCPSRARSCRARQVGLLEKL